MSTLLEDNLRNALSGMMTGPNPLIDAIRFYAAQARKGKKHIDHALCSRICGNPNDEVRKLLNHYLGIWDWEPNAPWTGSTKANTRTRRDRIYELLRIGSKLKKALNEFVPFYEGAKAVVIEDPATLRKWYTFEFRKKYNFYWKRLRDFLERTGKIGPDGINSIGGSADHILERLGDPASSEVFKARGLVVGYVQSGKTTNFTAVIAKAIDAGYRLIIVLSGTTNLLRNQTQRRLDMELVGKENILRGMDTQDAEHDYLDDEGWPEKFISYGRQPSLLGHVDIHRLTGQEDFRSRGAGLNPLEFDFEKLDRQRPLFDRKNLDHAGARIAVVKKQPDRMKALIRELKNVGEQKCAEVPTLIIDDESDQASVNTVDPKKVKDPPRSRINERVVELLRLLPRAQYLGYTATPFANVFVNPNDPDDIYPKDFIVSLERPAEYMGAREFLDFDEPSPGKLSNEEAHVRDIPKQKEPSNDRLLDALDAFLLTGAIKKYRQKKSRREAFKHHTMLYHHSVSKDDHLHVVGKIQKKWKEAGYDSPGPASSRLERLLDEDFRKVWAVRGKDEGLKFPRKFSELRPFLGEALDEIRRGNSSSPVLMVNSADGAEVPDFDGKVGVWKIIVGGAKLSRGYTIEGLTISYFRRRTRMQDTLIQMGRWFGYRPGYKDLIRLYIGRSEPIGKNTVDLYRAFEAIYRDEEDFRGQLAMYEGKGGITPKQVPALVFSSYPSLRPTSRNKMFNTKIIWSAFYYREPTSQAATGAGRTDNATLFKTFISKLNVRDSHVGIIGGSSRGFDVKWANASQKGVLEVLSKIRWEKTGSPIEAQIEFLRRKSETPIDSWIFLAPVERGDAGLWKFDAHQFQCIARKRLESRFGVYSSPVHLDYAKWLVGGSEKEYKSILKPQSRTGILLFYPTRELGIDKKETKNIPVMGFGIVLPKASGSGQRIAYSV